MTINAIPASAGYITNRPATAPDPQGGNEFANIVSNLAQTLQNSESAAMESMTQGGDPHTLVQALAQTELAVETAVTVRNKVVEAYQEILRMPV